MHGIIAGDVLDAPHFAHISDYLLSLLCGRVAVAHDASFGMPFLHREPELPHYDVADRPKALCCMKWARRTIGAAKLAHCCEAFGISLNDAHSALDDARATAALSPHLIS
ncbi:MAG: PolC-type DNA polymerase III [Mycobacterium sp.]